MRTPTRRTSRRRCCSPPTPRRLRRSLAGRSSSPALRGARRSATSATTRWSRSATPSCGCRRAACPGAGRRSSTWSSAPAIPRRTPATCCWSARTRRPRPSCRTWPGSGRCAFAPATQPSRRPSARPPACAPGCRSRRRRPWCSRTSSPTSLRASACSSAGAWSPTPTGSPRRRGSRRGCSSPTRRLRPSPAGPPRTALSWKGHLSKFTGFNCLPGEGPQASSKYGVATVREAPGRSLYVNLVAVSGAPFGGLSPSEQLRVDTAQSSLDVTRFRA